MKTSKITFEKKVCSIKTYLFLTILGLSFAFGNPQNSQGQSKTNKLQVGDSWVSSFFESHQGKQIQKINSGTVRIVAVMVEFQADENRFTTGNGTFNPDYLDSTNVVIDPLPHDKAYFEAHLKFVKHYFETASKGKLKVEYEVLPTEYKLDNEMAYYAPTGTDSSEDYKLGNFLKDVWEKVDSDPSVSVANWDDTTCFLVFHAGAGRDFDFLSTTLDRTPQDIPSLYLNLSGLQSLLQESTFSGFSVKGFNVKNTGILPETQSRTGVFLENAYVFQLAINGFVTAVVGNHIGLPDLYNTLTGSSGIGRFGLMDPEGFFAYFGLIPPLPSAWERMYMEWDEVEEIKTTTSGTISLEAVSKFPNNSIKKFNISPTEYYLIENRHRDVNGNGITLQVQEADGTITAKTFTNSDTKFSPNNSDSLIQVFPKGVLVAVSNYDFALPGGLDVGNDGEYFTADDRNLNGGILIWHIDETVIEQNLSSNRINANPDRKGIQLIEADGSQDIGKTINNIFLSSVVAGTAFDFWWSGNNYTVITERGDSIRVYENRFAPDTRPSTLTNAGGYNPVELYDFSDNLPTASFKIRTFQNGFTKDARFEKSSLSVDAVLSSVDYPQSAIFYVNNSDSILIIPGENGVFALPFDTTKSRIPVKIAESSLRNPLLYQNKLIIAQSESQIVAFSFDGLNWNTDWTAHLSEPITAGLSITNGMIDIEMSSYVINPLDGQISLFAQKNDITSSSINGNQAILQSNTLSYSGGSVSLPAGTQLSTEIHLGAVGLSNVLYWFLRTDQITWFINSSTNVVNEIYSSPYWPVFRPNSSKTDIEILSVTSSGKLQSTLLNGTMSDGFPMSISGREFIFSPISAHLDSDELEDIIVMAKDSLRYMIYAFDSNHDILDGFPIDAGKVISGKMPLQPIIEGKRLYVISTDGDINVWNLLNQTGKVNVSLPQNDGKWNFQISESISTPIFDGILNKNETYNWPNPAKDETFIRFQTQKPAEIQIDIYSMSGKKVWSKTTTTISSSPTETPLNTSSWGSGLYYIRILATVDGDSDTKIVKLLVEH